MDGIDDPEAITVVCSACGLRYRGRRTADGAIVPTDGRTNCRCGESEFETWAEKVASSRSEIS